MATYKVPKSPAKSIMTINHFLGVDFTNSPANIDINRSPNAENMIRDVPGKVRKSMGWEVVQQYGDNLIPFPYLSQGGTADGITTLVASDGSIKVSGTETSPMGYGVFAIASGNYRPPNGRYILSGTPSNSNGSFLRIQGLQNGAFAGIIADDYSNGATFDIDYNGYDEVEIVLVILTNTSVDCIFKPMLVKYSEEKQPINGFHYIKGSDTPIVHYGTDFYYGTRKIYSGANNALSKSWQFDDKLYILDGLKMLVFGFENDAPYMKSVGDSAKIPVVTISKNPTGGGTSYEDLNLLQPGFEEHFLGTADATEYSLSFSPLDDTEVKIEVLGADGEWQTKVEDTDFTVDRQTGVVTFTTAPGVSPVTGEDNIKITAYRTVEGYADRINKCTFGILYGANGGHDRLFVSGNPDYINYDWHSESYDPTYFSDTSYARLGSDASRIVGYSRVSSYLATHKDDFEKDQNIILRSGSTIDDLTVFKIANSLSGAGAIASGSFGYLANEPLFLTSQGIFAITAQDVTGEKYAQNRSFYLNGKLLEEENLEDACSVVFKDMYWLCVNDRCYILDGLQAVQTDKSMPYATRQYCGFYRTNVPANVMWVYDNKLWFGTRDGRICRFHTDKGSVTSYNDNGLPISACWETPDIDGNLFYKNKSVRYLAVRLESAIATSIKIWAMERGLWNFVTSDDAAGRFFTYKNFTYSKFTYACDRTQKITKTKLRIKKVDKFRLKFENDKTNEPFGLYDVAIEFVENGNFKG